MVCRSDKQLAELRDGSTTATDSVLYGVSTGASIGDMVPFQGTATKFIQTVCAKSGANIGDDGGGVVRGKHGGIYSSFPRA